MTSDPSADAFVCAACSAPASFAGTCAQCEGRLVERRELPPWGLVGRQDIRPTITAFGALRYVMLMALGSLVAWFVTRDSYTRTPILALLPVVWLLALLVDFVRADRLAREWRTSADAPLRNARNVHADAASLESATDGAVVRVRGVVKIKNPTFSETGERCAAAQRTRRIPKLQAPGSGEGPAMNLRTRGGPSVRISMFDGTLSREARGGVFEIVGRDGVVATVRGSDLLLTRDGTLHDGDVVEVVGRVRRRPLDAEESVVHHRAAAIRHEIVGSADAPIVVDRLGGGEDAPANVRIAADSPHDDRASVVTASRPEQEPDRAKRA